MRKATVIALCGALLWNIAPATAHAQSDCIPEAGRPAVSTGDITTEATSIGVKINVRHAGQPVAVTVYVTVDYGDRNPYDTTVVVPATPDASVRGSSTERRTTA